MNKVDFSEPLHHLNIIGMHPTKINFFSTLRHCFSIAVYITTLSSGILELVFNSKGLETYARALISMVPQYQLLAKMVVLILNREKIQKLLNDTQHFWHLFEFGPNHQKKLSSTHFYLKRFFFFYKYCTAFTCLQFHAVFFVMKFVNYNNKPMCISFEENEEHGLVYDTFYLALHVFVTGIAISIITGFDGLLFYFIGHTLSELEMIKIAFSEEEILKTWNEKKRFRVAVRHHSNVLTFIEELNEIFSTVFLVQHTSSFFGICFGLFMISQDGLPPSLDVISRYIPYIILLTTQSWTFCFAGHLVYDWASEIPIQIFYNGWEKKYGYDNVQGRIIAMKRGQKSVKLTLGGFGALNLESFKSVMQKCFSFLAFINTMMEKKNSQK